MATILPLFLLTVQPTGPADLRVVRSAEAVVALVRQGTPVTVVHFFATWCGTCLDELPEIRRLETQLAKTGANLMLVSLDEPGQGRKVADFLKKERLLAWPGASAVLLDAPDPGAITSRFDAKWAAQLPATFLLLQSGAVVVSHLGITPVDRLLSEVRARLGPVAGHAP